MSPALVHTKLVEVLKKIQADSGLECPAIDGKTKPVEALPKFDSKIWPVAIGMLADELKITIANDVNIFRRDKECIALTVEETVAMVVAIAEEQESSSAQAVSEK